MKTNVFFSLFLWYVFLLVLMNACNISNGGGMPPGGNVVPDQLHFVKASWVNGVNSREQIIVDKSITKQPIIQELYQKIASLPPAKMISASCPRGSHYRLTFLQQQHTILNVSINECSHVNIDKNDVDIADQPRSSDQDFKTLLQQIESN